MAATKRAIEVARKKLVESHEAGEHKEQVPNCPECNPDIVTNGSSGSGVTDGGEAERAKLDAKPEPKSEPKAKAQPTLDATTAKRLKEIRSHLDRVEALKVERLKLIREAHELGIKTSEISKATGLSVPRLRQLLGPNGK
jgi:hypothetical protein